MVEPAERPATLDEIKTLLVALMNAVTVALVLSFVVFVVAAVVLRTHDEPAAAGVCWTLAAVSLLVALVLGIVRDSSVLRPRGSGS